MEVFTGKSSIHGPFSIAMFDYGKVSSMNLGIIPPKHQPRKGWETSQLAQAISRLGVEEDAGILQGLSFTLVATD